MIRLRWLSSSPHPIPDPSVRDSLNRMRRTEALTDCRILTGTQGSFPCHQLVLGSASSVFREILKVNQGGRVSVALGEEHGPFVDTLLSFIYTGEVLLAPGRVLGVCRLADRLHIKLMVDGVSRTPESLAIKENDKALAVISAAGGSRDSGRSTEKEHEEEEEEESVKMVGVQPKPLESNIDIKFKSCGGSAKKRPKNDGGSKTFKKKLEVVLTPLSQKDIIIFGQKKKPSEEEEGLPPPPQMMTMTPMTLRTRKVQQTPLPKVVPPPLPEVMNLRPFSSASRSKSKSKSRPRLRRSAFTAASFNLKRIAEDLMRA